MRSRDSIVRSVLTILIVGACLGTAWSAASPGRWFWMGALAIGSTVMIWQLVRLGVPSLRTIVVVAVALRLAWLLVPPGLSDDAYRYAWDGLLVWEGENPYEHPPADSAYGRYQANPLFERLNSAEFYSVYPPVSQVAFVVSHVTSGGRWPGFYYSIKAVATVFDLGTLWLLAATVSPAAVLVYAWSPVVLVAGAGAGHTDAIVMFWLVLLVIAARRRNDALSGIALAMAAMVKILPVLALPWIVARGRSKTLVGFVATAAVFCAPFAAWFVLPNLMDSLDLYVRYFEFNSGPYYAVKGLFTAITGDDWSKQIGPFFRWLFFAAAAGMTVAAVRHHWTPGRFLIGLHGAFIVLSTTVHPWYLAGMIALYAADDRHGWSWQWLAAASMGTYVLYAGGPYWLFVWIGWVGFAVIGLVTQAPVLVERALRMRADWKAELLIREAVRSIGVDPEHPASFLDLGGAEGYVAQTVLNRTNWTPVVADVAVSGRAVLPVTRLSGDTLPFEDKTFDIVFLGFVLHHARDPRRLLLEAVRVSGGCVVILESVCGPGLPRAVSESLDRVAEILRHVVDPSWWRRLVRKPGTGTTDQAASTRPRHRTAQGWRLLFEDLGFNVGTERAMYNPLHHKHLYVIETRVAT